MRGPVVFISNSPHEETFSPVSLSCTAFVGEGHFLLFIQSFFSGFVIGPLGCSNFFPGPSSHHPDSPYLCMLYFWEAVSWVYCDMPPTLNSP